MKMVIKELLFIYNVVRNNDELVCNNWFDTYKIDNQDNLIIGYKRNYEDLKRLSK